MTLTNTTLTRERFYSNLICRTGSLFTNQSQEHSYMYVFIAKIYLDLHLLLKTDTKLTSECVISEINRGFFI